MKNQKQTPEQRRVSSLLNCVCLNSEYADGCAKDGNDAKAAFFDAEALRCMTELKALSEASPKSILTVSEISKLLRATARAAIANN
jgi:hypothetical protein